MQNQEFYNIENKINIELLLKKTHNFVFLHLTCGEIQISINEKSFELYANDSVLVLPDESYSVITYEKSACLYLEFSRHFIDDFYSKIASKQAVMPVFKVKSASVIDDIKSDNLLLLKSAVYKLAYKFLNLCPLEARNNKVYDFMEKAISFIENNYAKDISLSSLASFYGYNYNYMSSLFNETFKTNFNFVVNNYRLNEAKKLLLQNDKTLTEIAFLCGFKSIRSFNRNFLDSFSMSPSEYVKSNIL